MDSLTDERENVQEELRSVRDPRQRTALIAELRALNQQIAAKLAQYKACINPPLPKPDLVAKTFQISRNNTARTMDVACVIQNNGDGPARGPFVVTLGVSFKNDRGVQITRQLNIPIPSGTTVEGHGTQYITDAMHNIPLFYRNEHPDITYQLEMIVDANNQVSEVSESNNYLGMNYWAV
ncbi:MAG: hypothetical protein ACJ8LM_15780, partial [Candidatus Udaeobacter sp.]